MTGDEEEDDSGKMTLLTALHLRFVSREEFMGEAPKRQPEPESAEKRAERAFKVFDKNHDGFVTKDEMLKLCKNLSKEQARTNYESTTCNDSGSYPWQSIYLLKL